MTGVAEAVPPLLLTLAMLAGLAAGHYARHLAAAFDPADTAPPCRPPVLLESLTALVFGALTWRFGVTPELALYLFVATIGVALAAIDLRHRLLPNAVVMPALGVVAVLVLAAAVAGADGGAAIRAVVGAVLLFVLYLVLALINPAGLGMGDVKLAALLGLALAFDGWTTLMTGAFLGFAVGAVISVGVLLTRRGGLRSSFPFGPAMLAGALVACFV
ncbi:A24 family peptidase [Tersicoccus sp. MR15.9]|uniref:A24 family peptidase n=1 Tax=Tersicoccus mangrovi TaxID=3121635 RepID=UPI002FE6C124